MPYENCSPHQIVPECAPNLGGSDSNGEEIEHIAEKSAK